MLKWVPPRWALQRAGAESVFQLHQQVERSHLAALAGADPVVVSWGLVLAHEAGLVDAGRRGRRGGAGHQEVLPGAGAPRLHCYSERGGHKLQCGVLQSGAQGWGWNLKLHYPTIRLWNSGTDRRHDRTRVKLHTSQCIFCCCYYHKQNVEAWTDDRKFAGAFDFD